ncbi:MAG TPA: type II toxin-antitoxin system RelE/ParE family toxin [Xanthomonadaceae bacterium]|nr:type II toxin-antitoxin system RelE/ParE family toxin [Xanthomonadaceae bacterium]
MTVRFLESAQAELDEAIAWYGAQAPGLGDAFLLEALKAIQLVERYPMAWHPLSENTRRCRLNRFPYGVIFTGDGDGILIIAVAHSHRRPGYWRDRIKGNKDTF